jgi:molecular chaperone HtpG
MKQGNLSVHTENIFPIIKKFLYSDQEIFLRELVANAVDATQKLKTFVSTGEFNEDAGDLTIKVSIDKENKTLTISDHGIGMTEDEVDRYINQIAFSSAEEFVQKYSDKKEEANAIIGHFGLGFYSAFMVADKVELRTKSYKPDAEAVQWTCIGTTSFEMEKTDKESRGTDIILHINPDAEEYLEEARIENILKKYCRFMPVSIEFKGEIINNSEPLWLKKPSALSEQDYIDFYKELYPYSEDPLFWIHLNVDYPFNLTGILYFPKINNSLELQKNKIQLYSNQVFVTDEVKEIVPEFLTLLHGVIDSPDIPLNVSRSYLQSDQNVKKISSYIVKKVGDKLAELFKEKRSEFESKWKDIGFFIKYGMLTDDKFYDKAKDFFLLNNLEDQFFTLEEYREKVKATQTDKNDTLVWLYASDAKAQHSYIESAKKRGYDVLLFDHPIDNHLIQQLESKLEKTSIRRVDADSMDKLIDKDVKTESVLSKDEESKLETIYKETAGEQQFQVKLEALSPDEAPVMIAQSEWMRRMKDMSRLSGMGSADAFPGGYELIVNTNHPLSKKIIEQGEGADAKRIASQLFDLARLSQHMLTGEELTGFISRSMQYLS